MFTDGWNQWNQWGHWNASGPGPGNWEWSGVPPPGVTIGPDGKPTGISNTPVAPAAPQISGNFNVPPPSASSPYVYNSVTNAQTYNQVIVEKKKSKFFHSIEKFNLIYYKAGIVILVR